MIKKVLIIFLVTAMIFAPVAEARYQNTIQIFELPLSMVPPVAIKVWAGWDAGHPIDGIVISCNRPDLAGINIRHVNLIVTIKTASKNINALDFHLWEDPHRPGCWGYYESKTKICVGPNATQCFSFEEAAWRALATVSTAVMELASTAEFQQALVDGIVAYAETSAKVLAAAVILAIAVIAFFNGAPDEVVTLPAAAKSAQFLASLMLAARYTTAEEFAEDAESQMSDVFDTIENFDFGDVGGAGDRTSINITNIHIPDVSVGATSVPVTIYYETPSYSLVSFRTECDGDWEEETEFIVPSSSSITINLPLDEDLSADNYSVNLSVREGINSPLSTSVGTLSIKNENVPAEDFWEFDYDERRTYERWEIESTEKAYEMKFVGDNPEVENRYDGKFSVAYENEWDDEYGSEKRQENIYHDIWLKLPSNISDYILKIDDKELESDDRVNHDVEIYTSEDIEIEGPGEIKGNKVWSRTDGSTPTLTVPDRWVLITQYTRSMDPDDRVTLVVRVYPKYDRCAGDVVRGIARVSILSDGIRIPNEDMDEPAGFSYREDPQGWLGIYTVREVDD